MTTLPVYYHGEHHRYLQGWVLSVLLHAAAVGAAITLVSDPHVAPQPEPFRWDVSVAEAPAPAQAEKLERSPAEPSPRATQPIEPKLATRPVQPVIRQEVRQEVSESPPVVQTPVQATQPVERTVQAVPDAPPAGREAEVPATTAVSAEAVPDSPPQLTAVAPPAAEATHQPVHEDPVRSIPATKVDYGWLADALWSRVERLKRYPHMARLNRWEGRVVLRVVIREDGHLLDLAVAESSGHSILDQDALEILRLASPLTLKQPLGKPQVVVQVPISYRLER